ncbi:MAG: SCO family protein [Zoogloeaceae bacterium]|nr:SCO family protein [Zoogloeaceae bacterium]
MTLRKAAAIMSAMSYIRLPRLFRSLILLLSCAASFAAPAAQEQITSRPINPATAPNVPVLNAEKALELSRSVINQSIGDFTLLDRKQKPVSLSSYRGKPLLVSFIYTGCFEVCPTTTKNLEKAVTQAVAVIGANRFNVISIGFNQPFDSPSAMKAFAAQNGIVFPNWEFLSPAPAIVNDLTRSFGFSYAATPAGFDHIVQITLVDAEGKIYRQIYGEAPTADLLVKPLKQLIAGAPIAETDSLSDLFDRVRILCSVYDPKTGKYRVDYALIFEIAGFLTFFLYISWYIWKGLRTKKTESV